MIILKTSPKTRTHIRRQHTDVYFPQGKDTCKVVDTDVPASPKSRTCVKRQHIDVSASPKTRTHVRR